MKFVAHTSQFAMLSAILFVVSFASTLNAQDSDARMFFVKVSKGQEIVGQLTDVNELKVKTEFGDVTIPLEKIEAIKMSANGSAVFAFINGDIISGQMDMQEVHLKTNWGKAHIKSAAIETISANRNGSFYTDPGGGWRYTRATPQTQPATNRFQRSSGR